jgi:hypothetical protein
MKRNQNLVRDMLKKQMQEQRKTGQFLKYALGKREVKSDVEIMHHLKTKAYQPYNDPLMPRIAKKFQQPKSILSASYMKHVQSNSTYMKISQRNSSGNIGRVLSQEGHPGKVPKNPYMLNTSPSALKASPSKFTTSPGNLLLHKRVAASVEKEKQLQEKLSFNQMQELAIKEEVT